MSNTVITNYTDLNGPSTKADSSVVVIVNKDGSLSVDQNLLGTLMGTDGSQAAGISVVRVGHEGKPDDATDSEGEDDKIPHVTLSVDSYYDEPNSIIKYDSGAEMLQSLRIETRENSLIGFQNDHCYTPLLSPSQSLPQRTDNFAGYDDPVIEITHTPPPKPVPSAKKITILEQQIIPKGRKIAINPQEGIILKGNDVLTKPLPVLTKSKYATEPEKSTAIQPKSEEENESSSASSSPGAISDRDSDSDYKDTKDRSGPPKLRKPKLKPRILKNAQAAKAKVSPKVAARLKANKSLVKREIKEKIISKNVPEKKQISSDVLQKESPVVPEVSLSGHELSRVVVKPSLKPVKKEKKTPAHVSALLTDMTSLFSTPDVIRRVSTENKPLTKGEKDQVVGIKKQDLAKPQEGEEKLSDVAKPLGVIDKTKSVIPQKTYSKQKDKAVNPTDKVSKGYDLIPQIDDASLAQILQDTPVTTLNKTQPNISTIHTMNSPSLAGPLSPTLDLLGALPSEEEGLSEDFLMHVAQLVESSENLQEVLDKQVLGKVDASSAAAALAPAARPPTPQTPASRSLLYQQTPTKTAKTLPPQKNPIEIVRRDGRVITLPPIEAPATRSSKRKSQMTGQDVGPAPAPVAAPAPAPAPLPPAPAPLATPEPGPEPAGAHTSRPYVNRKLPHKKPEPAAPPPPPPAADKTFTESQESWNSEDDPYRLWCICKQPHNNRFMICCDSCEDWFHGKCVNITKAMGQQMEEDGIEWRCPNCVKKTKPTPKTITNKMTIQKKQEVESDQSPPLLVSPPASKVLSSKTSCIVCKKPARASSIYCSDACILKHAQDSLGNQTPGKGDGDTHHDKSKSDSRVIVYERKSGRVLAGPNAPTPENLKVWLQKNPTFEVVRPGALSAIKPNVMKKKAAAAATKEPTRIQTTLNFERIPKKQGLQTKELKEIPPKLMYSREEPKTMTSPKTPVTPKSQQPQFPDTPRASTSGLRTIPEPRKLVRTANRSVNEKTPKAPSVSPAAARKKDTPPDTKSKMKSAEPIRDNVRKALQEQMTARMAENTGPKFSENEIRQFAYDTEFELHELFRDVGMKYKAKYRSLMFNIKDRKNLSLWQKICDKTITPKQLVRLSPEELASQELAQWRDKEAKYQLELIKKSELDLLAASKTYVLKTHKGEEVMETKESVSTELDPNVPVEDLVSALNDSTATEEPSKDNSSETAESPVKADSKKHSSKKSAKDSHSKKSSRESKRDSESRKSRSSRRKSDIKDKDERHTRRSEKRTRAASKDRSRRDSSKEKESERSRRRSRSRTKSKKRSKSREHSRSLSQSRDESRLRRHSRRSKSKEPSRRRNSSRSKHRSSTDDKAKHRSRSQEVVYTKSKNESTDSDSLERPKSAMLKEAHPEYDPHEPMITSAFSEEDLRKSRDDVYEDSYNKNEIGDYSGTEYDPSKTFAVDASLLPGSTFASPKPSSEKLEKVAEAESDQEPSSTVEHSSAPVWNGCINMVDVARFYVAAHEVSGTAADIEEDLSTELDIVGRINPDTVWDYISKMKRASNKDIIILKLQAANDEEKMQYIALYSYLSSRNRLGVVRVLNTTLVKDFYIVPLPAHTALPAVLLPLDGPEPALETRTHLLVAIVIRQRKKRVAAAPPAAPLPAKQVRRSSRKRSYTPPVLAAAAASYTPPASPRRRALPLPTAYTSPKLSTSVKDKIAATLASADDDEAYSPGSSTSSGSAPSSLRCKMEELNRQIEEQKQQIRKMTQADSAAAGEDEAYSPSRPMTPPGASAGVVPLADIALPSNLQEILATIKQRSEPAAADVDMRLPQQLP